MYIDMPPNFGRRASKARLAAARARKAAAYARFKHLRQKLRPGSVTTGDPLQDLLNIATSNGYEGDVTDLQAMANFIAEELGTDGVWELLEELAAAGLITLPR